MFSGLTKFLHDLSFSMYFFIKMYYRAEESPLPACPYLHTTVGLLNVNSFRFLSLKLNLDSIYYPAPGKAKGLKRFEITYEVLIICTINVAGFKPDLNKFEKNPKICKKIHFFHSFFNFVQWMEWKEFWSKLPAWKQKPIRAYLRPSFLTYNILYY